MLNYILITTLVFGLFPAPMVHSEPINPAQFQFIDIPGLVMMGTALLVQNATKTPETRESAVKAVYTRTITAYSSSPEETDNTPFITASGNYVRMGTVAANWLPLGTAIRIPGLFGEQVFIVEDRMNRRHADKIDVWFPNKEDALKFGRQIAQIEVL